MYEGLYRVVRKGDKFNVVRDDGRVVATRHRVSFADEVADDKNFGRKIRPERQQIIESWRKLHISEEKDCKRTWKIIDNNGVCVRSFKYEYLANWWLQDYNLQRDEVRRQARARERSELNA